MKTSYNYSSSITNQLVQELIRAHHLNRYPRPVTPPLRLDRTTLSILPVRATNLAPQSDMVCLLTFKMGNEAMGASPGKAPFTELLGLSPAFDVCPEGLELSLGCDNIIFKLSIVADFGEMSPVVQFPNGFPESIVVGSVSSEHVAEPAGHGFVGISAVVGGAEVHF